MKKAILFLSLFVAVVFGAYAQPAAAGGGVPLPINIDGTNWSGTVKVIASDGTLQEVETTVSFSNQSGNFFIGTMTDLSDPNATVSLTGVVGPVNPRLLHITAADQVILADVVRAGRANKLFIRGGSTATGTTFMGVLLRQ
ncbi:MAG: hypothetical protein AB9873_00320 [Syntrophobacteraceae bacterium]